MALIKCPECGKEISDTVKVCPNCGFKIKIHKKKMSKKKKIIIGATCGIIFIASLGIGATVVYLTSPIARFQKELLSQNYEEAKNILTQNISDDFDDYLKAKKKAVNIMEDTLDDYASGKSKYDECKKIEKFVAENFESVDCNDYDKSLDLIKDSKKNFNSAESKKNKKEYLDAISYYEKVSEEDIENYENAKEEIQICQDEYKNEIVAEIQKQANSDTPEKGYSAIANKVSQNDWINKDDDVSQELAKLNEIVKDSVITNVDKLSGKKKYSDAMKYIDKNLPDEYRESEEINEKITSIKKLLVTDTVKKSDKYLAQGKLESAEKVLKQNIDYDMNNTLQQKLNNVKKKIKKAALSEFRTLKQQVEIGYDSVDKSYSVAGNGYSTEYVNISPWTNIEAKMYVDKSEKTASFFLVLGFEQEDWIFTERIKIVSGKYSAEIPVDYSDRQTQVYLGGIAEWVMLVDTSSFDEFYDIGVPSLDSDTIDAIDVITSSKKVTIRFYGEGKRDHVVTDSEKKNIKNIRRMYELLQEYPELYAEF